MSLTAFQRVRRLQRVEEMIPENIQAKQQEVIEEEVKVEEPVEEVKEEATEEVVEEEKTEEVVEEEPKATTTRRRNRRS